jgi:hypothetical protein
MLPCHHAMQGYDAMNNLSKFIDQLQSDSRFSSLDEAATRQGIVLKILSLLGWDPFNVDEVQPEYGVKDGKIDFSLRYGGINKAFVMVKKRVANYRDCQRQLVSYCLEEKTDMAILTNGISWWFYLPLMEGPIEDKRFLALKVNEQKTEELTTQFFSFLSKTNIASGEATKAARVVCQRRHRARLWREYLPKAWERIMLEPQKWLAPVVSEITKGLCGFSPDERTLQEFVISQMEKSANFSARKTDGAFQKIEDTNRKPPARYEGKSVTSFTFEGTSYQVASWNNMLIKICNIMFAKHTEDFEMVLTLVRGNREYFSKSPYQFLKGEHISGTNIYVDASLSTPEVATLCLDILSLFGYEEKDLTIETISCP